VKSAKKAVAASQKPTPDVAQADCCGDSLRQAGDPMNPWDELKKLSLDMSEAARNTLGELMSRPIIDFFIPIEEIEQWSGTN